MKSFCITYSFIKIFTIYFYKYIFYLSLINKEKLILIFVIKKKILHYRLSYCILILEILIHYFDYSNIYSILSESNL